MTGLREIPRSVWTLGFVSMLMDVSSEMIHSLLLARDTHFISRKDGA